MLRARQGAGTIPPIMGTPKAQPPRTVFDWVWAPFSLLVWPTTIVVMAVAVTGAAIGCLFMPFQRFQLYWSSPVLGVCLPIAGGWRRLQIHPEYDRKRTSVYIQNHVSMLDAHTATWSIPAPFCGLNNAAHLKVPFYGWLLAMAKTIPVPRGGGASRYQVIADAFAQRHQQGISILAFPEGHRTLDGKVRKFRRGVFAAAAQAGLPVVPFMTRGLRRVLPKGTWLVKPGRVDVLIGPQIDTAGLTQEQIEDLTNTVQRMHAAWSERGENVVDEELAGFRARLAQSQASAPDASAASR